MTIRHHLRLPAILLTTLAMGIAHADGGELTGKV